MRDEVSKFEKLSDRTKYDTESVNLWEFLIKTRAVVRRQCMLQRGSNEAKYRVSG